MKQSQGFGLLQGRWNSLAQDERDARTRQHAGLWFSPWPPPLALGLTVHPMLLECDSEDADGSCWVGCRVRVVLEYGLVPVGFGGVVAGREPPIRMQAACLARAGLLGEGVRAPRLQAPLVVPVGWS